MAYPILAPHSVEAFGERHYVSPLTARLVFAVHRKTAGTRIMYDSTSLAAIPQSAAMVASYDTGYPQSPAAWARFSGKPEIHIVQRSGVYTEGDVLDVEPGCAGTQDCFPFIKNRKARGYFRPTIYGSLSWVPAIRSATGRYRLGVDYDLWVADWDGTLSNPYPGVAVKQYASTHSYDLNAVFDSGWPHRKGIMPPPPPPPASTAYKQVATGSASLLGFEAARYKVAVSSPAAITAAQDVAELTALYATAADLKAFVDYLISPGADRAMPDGLVFFTAHK